jgi:hypothetical protein
MKLETDCESVIHRWWVQAACTHHGSKEFLLESRRRRSCRFISHRALIFLVTPHNANWTV